MGRNFKVFLGYLLVISLKWSVDSASLQRNNRFLRNVNPIIPKVTSNTTNPNETNISTTESQKLSTSKQYTTTDNIANETKNITSQNNNHGDNDNEKETNSSQIENGNQEKLQNKTKETGRSLNIDINKYVSPEFHNKNNVYTFPTSPEIQQYTDPDIHQISERIDLGDELLESSSSPLDLLDEKYRNVADTIKQNLEELESSLKDIEQTNEEENDKYVIPKLINHVKNKNNDTNASLHVKETKTLEKVDEVNGNHRNGSETLTKQKNVDFDRNFYSVKTYDEKESNENPNNISDNKNKPVEQIVESTVKKLSKERITTEVPSTTRAQKETAKPRSRQFSMETTTILTSTKSANVNVIITKRGSVKYGVFTETTTKPSQSTTPTPKEMIDFDGKGFSIPPSATAWSLATLKNVPEMVTVDINGTISITTAKNVDINSIDSSKKPVKDSVVEENSLVKVVTKPQNISDDRVDTFESFEDSITTVSHLNTDIITTDAPPKTTPTMIWTTLWEEMKRIVNQTELPGLHPFTSVKNGSHAIKDPPKSIGKHENEIFKTSEEAPDIKTKFLTPPEKEPKESILNITDMPTSTEEVRESSETTINSETQTTTESTTKPLIDFSIKMNDSTTTEMSVKTTSIETITTAQTTEDYTIFSTTEESSGSTTENSFTLKEEKNTTGNLTSKPDLRIVSVTESPLLDEPVTNITKEEKTKTEANEIETTEVPTVTTTTRSITFSPSTELTDVTMEVSSEKTSITTIETNLDKSTPSFLDPIVDMNKNKDHPEEKPKEKHTSKEVGPKSRIEPAVIENTDDDIGNKISDEETTRSTLTVEIKTTETPKPTSSSPSTTEETSTSTSTTTSTTTSSENLVHDNDEKDQSNPGMIAAIAISSIAVICLILLAGLLIVMRKRQKRVTYGQRCRPVSLDAYSLDNVSVYNSVRRKGGARASKRSYGNPAFDDPVSVSHLMSFQALAKFNDNQEGITSEFEEIPQITAKTSELPAGCETKNRYANIIPLPESRVFLKGSDNDPQSDYINANYVMGSKNARCYYIACQAPMENTRDDFWRMIWEQNCRVILMLTQLYEIGVEKCADYLPPSEVLDCHRLFGDFQITLKKRDVKEKYIISSLQLKNMVSNSWREVTHLWYLGWPERGVPHELNSLIAFLIEARSHLKPTTINNNQGNDEKSGERSNLRRAGVLGNEGGGPVVVHCSPGTGRTGTVIACDIAIRDFELTRQVDIPKIVYKIRRDRASAVQTRDQYAYIYKVITLYATKLTGGALDSI